MLKIKVGQSEREYVSLDSLPLGAVFIVWSEGYCHSENYFIKTQVSTKSFPYDHSSEVCDVVCLNDGLFYLIQRDTKVHEVKADLTIFDD